MSDIPKAREILQSILDSGVCHYGTECSLKHALRLLDRKKPAFVAKRHVRPLSEFNRSYARDLRATGMSLNEIAGKLKSNIGRVSEACA